MSSSCLAAVAQRVHQRAFVLTSARLSHTHTVINQVADLVNVNAYTEDRACVEAVRVHGAEWAEDELVALGAAVGSEHFVQAGHLANKHTPTHVSHSRQGHRIDRVDFHPSWHELMTLGVSHGACLCVCVRGVEWCQGRKGSVNIYTVPST